MDLPISPFSISSNLNPAQGQLKRNSVDLSHNSSAIDDGELKGTRSKFKLDIATLRFSNGAILENHNGKMVCINCNYPDKKKMENAVNAVLERYN